MVEAGRFVDGLKAAGVEFFAGVPDSLLKSFCAYVADTCGENHMIAANEGGAVGLVVRRSRRGRTRRCSWRRYRNKSEENIHEHEY